MDKIQYFYSFGGCIPTSMPW